MSETGFERVPPQDKEAEQAVLGGMLLSKAAIADVIDVLNAGSDFYEPRHQSIYRAILDLYGRGEPADPITVSDELTKSGEIGRVGGESYVHSLVQMVPSAANAEYYAEIVHEKAVRRRFVEFGHRVVHLAHEGDADGDELVNAVQADLNASATVRENSDAALIGDGFDDYLDRLEARQRGETAKGVPTGFTDLDQLTNGLHPGQIIIIAGRPAMGKSTLALDFARTCAIKHGRPAAFFSLEMSRDELRDRTISAQARVGLHHIRGVGVMTDGDWDRVAKMTSRVTAAPLTIDATPGQTLMSIKARCLRLQQHGGLDLVVIDYLQLLQSGSSRRVENRQIEVSQMSRNLKLMAKELGVPVVVLAQLNRGPEQRTDKKPVKSDLRESGSLEQDADVVILVHREDAYEKESPRAGEADLIVAKHRNGPEATITVAFQGHYSRFVDMAQT
jgi:replicative DNA helicase